jgi:fructokinase
MNNHSVRIGIDVGGTKIEGAVFTPDFKLLFRERRPTEADLGYERVLSQIQEVYSSLLQKSGVADASLGIGTPGSPAPSTGLMRNSNAQCLNNRPLHADLQKRLGRSFTLQNDANCFALAEARWGAATGRDLVFGIILGSGCGGGMVWKGVIHTGQNRIGGEWGHTVLDPKGPECYCGKRGCAELYVSGTGMERYHAQLSGQNLRAHEIIAASHEGQPDALKATERFFEHLGIGVSNILNTLDPDAIVFGGGLSNWPDLYTRGAVEIRRRTFGGYCKTPLLPNQLGDSAGVWGAASLE